MEASRALLWDKKTVDEPVEHLAPFDLRLEEGD